MTSVMRRDPVAFCTTQEVCIVEASVKATDVLRMFISMVRKETTAERQECAKGRRLWQRPFSRKYIKADKMVGWAAWQCVPIISALGRGDMRIWGSKPTLATQ